MIHLDTGSSAPESWVAALILLPPEHKRVLYTTCCKEVALLVHLDCRSVPRVMVRLLPPVQDSLSLRLNLRKKLLRVKWLSHLMLCKRQLQIRLMPVKKLYYL